MRTDSAGIADILAARLPRLAGGGMPDADFRIGLVGRSIQQSRSPFMHEQEGRRLGLRYSYALIDFDELALPDPVLPDVIDALARMGFAGLNVTHPFKQSVVGGLDALSPEAEAIGAVNTVVLRDGKKVGHNTDSWGFAESFREEMAGVPLDAATQFGAGGAGAAVAYALMQTGIANLEIVDSDARKAELLAARMNARFPGRLRASADVADSLAASNGVINTTPVGMAKYPGAPFPVDLLRPEHWVAEIIYFPQETELLRAARRAGCRVLPGIGMAVNQAARAFELFTGLTADRAAMSRHFGAAA